MRLILKIFYRLLYYELALTYDLVSWLVSFGKWKEWLLTSLDFLDEDPILELGVGPGHLQQALAKANLAHFGLDLSPQMTRMASRRMIKAGYEPDLVQADSMCIPFASRSISQIVSTFPTEVLIHPQTVGEIARVLKPGGKLVLIPMVYITGKGIVHKLIAWLYRITSQTIPPDRLEDTKYREIFEREGLIAAHRLIKRDQYTLVVIEARLDITI